MLDAVRNVGIKDGRIAVVTTEAMSGKDSIDGTTTGMDLELGALHVKDWYDKKAEQGWQVNSGTTASPNLIRMTVHDPEVKRDEPVDCSNAPGYLDEAEKDGTAGWSVTRSEIQQMNCIMQTLGEEMRQGAIGVGATCMARGMTAQHRRLHRLRLPMQPRAA
jgi:N-acyl-D-amino-acid deacylase